MSSDETEWKAIDGHPFYEVSRDGQVRSLDMVLTYSNGRTRRKKGRVLRSWDNIGYRQVQLTKGKAASLHRLIAKAFLEPVLGCDVINHKNGNRSDNRIENLEWCTTSENSKHAYDVLGRKPVPGQRGGDSPRSRAVSGKSLITGEIRTYRASSETVADGFLAAKVGACCLGRRKTHANHIWWFT